MDRGPKPLAKNTSNAPHSGLAPAQIAESERLALLDHVEAGICVVHDDAIVYANQPLLALLGHASLAELGARRVSAVTGAVDFAAWVFATEAEAHTQRWTRADGTVAVVDVSMAPLRFDGSDARMVMVRDATATERSKRTDRLALIATLSAGIAHQLNNPLAYVLANLNFLAEEIPPFLRECAPSFDATQHEVLTDMLGAMADAREGAERIARVVRALRECARAEDERRDLVDVRVLLDAACANSELELGDRGRVTKQYESVALVEASSARLSQAFAAVLRNAVQSISENATAPLEITVRTYLDASDGMVVVEVSDTGCGMGPSVQAHIFDPFYSRKPIGEATGLGLTMVLAIVHGANGTISVQSEEKIGSTFRVRLPAAASRKVVRDATSTVPEAAARQRVLIVDDELTLLSSLRRALASEAEVELARSAEQAMELLERDDHFDVVLCDIMMPEVTGIELFERVAQTHPHLRDRFVFMTGGTPTASVQEFIDGAGLPYLEKPFDMRQLMKLLRRVKASTIQ
jgi:signal transduction histidine kinase/ActR/RegA family two-component response regulator